MLKRITLAACFLLAALPQISQAQCAANEVEIEVFIETDSYGYEAFWSLVYGTSNCGVNEIASGGNSSVGCNGGGLRNVNGGGYGNMQVYQAGPFCVPADTTLTLHSIDDWGDGGTGFTITVNGYVVLAEDVTGSDDVYTFNASEPPAIEAAMDDIRTPFTYSAAGVTDVEASFVNNGTDTITSIDVSYQLDGGSTQSTTLNGLSIPYGDHYEFTHPTTFNVANGNHDIKIWIGNVNGQANGDSIATNDTIARSFVVGPGTPNIIDDYVNAVLVHSEIGNVSDQLNKPTDLDFHPVLTRKELWVINKRIESSGGSTVTYFNAGESNQTDLHRVDGNAWHFMSLPTGIAFSENENFANSPGVYDANHNGGLPFTGPALWSSDPNIYAQPSGGNGSHLDMLHNSPRSQGIAHERDNVFWVFDGESDDIVRYDFAEDHGPGASYHGDAIVRRYRDDQVQMDADEIVPSHLVLHKETDWLYVVDHGNQRVMRLDITTGTVAGNATIHNYEPVEEYVNMTGYTWETVVSTGLIEPAGIDVVGDRMIVSDYSTGEIIIYDISAMPATELDRFTTPAQGIMGVKIGPEGQIWYVDHDANKVFCAKVSGIGLADHDAVQFNLFPNPNNGSFTIRLTQENSSSLEIINSTGQVLFTEELTERISTFQFDLQAGIYFAKVTDASGAAYTEKIIVQ